MDAAVHATVAARSARRRDELRDGCEFEQDTPVEIEVEEEEEECEVDAASIEVGVAQSETASTVSRAAFSLSDKAEIEREGTRDMGGEREKRRGKDNTRAQLRAAYVRELLLSSLSS